MGRGVEVYAPLPLPSPPLPSLHPHLQTDYRGHGQDGGAHTVAQQQVHHRQVQPGMQHGQAGAAANASSRPEASSAEQEDTTGVS